MLHTEKALKWKPLYRKNTTNSNSKAYDHLVRILTILLFFSVRTAEWCLPLVHLNRALATVIQLAQDYASKHRQYSLLPIYVRLVKTDDLFMSPANMFRPDTEGAGSKSEKNCYIEVREILGSAPSVSNSRKSTPYLLGLKKAVLVTLRVFILERSTARAFAVPKNMTGVLE